jgi:hypothetical protein
VLLNTKGEVIGVTTFNVKGGQNLNFAVPAKYIKPLLLSRTILPFAPKQIPPEPATEALPKEVEESTLPKSLPTEWKAVENGTPVTVRLEGDYLNEHSEFDGDGSYSRRVEDNCETKLQGKTFVGKCHRRIWLNWGSAFGDNVCSVEMDEIITSVTPRRIEGEGQTLEPPSHPSKCPTPGASREKFAYIPKH